MLTFVVSLPKHPGRPGRDQSQPGFEHESKGNAMGTFAFAMPFGRPAGPGLTNDKRQTTNDKGHVVPRSQRPKGLKPKDNKSRIAFQ